VLYLKNFGWIFYFIYFHLLMGCLIDKVKKPFLVNLVEVSPPALRMTARLLWGVFSIAGLAFLQKMLSMWMYLKCRFSAISKTKTDTKILYFFNFFVNSLSLEVLGCLSFVALHTYHSIIHIVSTNNQLDVEWIKLLRVHLFKLWGSWQEFVPRNSLINLNKAFFSIHKNSIVNPKKTFFGVTLQTLFCKLYRFTVKNFLVSLLKRWIYSWADVIELFLSTSM